MHFSLATSRAQSFFAPLGSFCPKASRAKDFVQWVGGRHLPAFYFKEISGSFSELLSAETSGHPFTHAMNDTNSRARDLDLASASSGVFNSSHLDFGHPSGRTHGRHACAIAAPLVTVGFQLFGYLTVSCILAVGSCVQLFSHLTALDFLTVGSAETD
jgi:hypothetical protein